MTWFKIRTPDVQNMKARYHSADAIQCTCFTSKHSERVQTYSTQNREMGCILKTDTNQHTQMLLYANSGSPVLLFQIRVINYVRNGRSGWGSCHAAPPKDISAGTWLPHTVVIITRWRYNITLSSVCFIDITCGLQV